MIRHAPSHSAIDPEREDAVMKFIPELDRTGADNCDLIYASTFLAVCAALEQGVTAEAVREQASWALRYIDGTDRPVYDKELFAALFARAVDDALAGRSPCVLH